MSKSGIIISLKFVEISIFLQKNVLIWNLASTAISFLFLPNLLLVSINNIASLHFSILACNLFLQVQKPDLTLTGCLDAMHPLLFHFNPIRLVTVYTFSLRL